MAATAPRVLVTDERQRPQISLEVHCIDRNTGAMLYRAITGLDGIAQFPSIPDTTEVLFRPMAGRNTGPGRLHTQIIKGADSDTVPPATFDEPDKADVDPRVWLVFLTAPQHVESDIRSDVITVERRDLADEPIIEEDQDVFLYSSSPGDYIFEVFDSGLGDYVEATQITILDGQSTASFYYTDSIAGNPVITASTESLV